MKNNKGTKQCMNLLGVLENVFAMHNLLEHENLFTVEVRQKTLQKRKLVRGLNLNAGK